MKIVERSKRTFHKNLWNVLMERSIKRFGTFQGLSFYYDFSLFRDSTFCILSLSLG